MKTSISQIESPDCRSTQKRGFVFDAEEVATTHGGLVIATSSLDIINNMNTCIYNLGPVFAASDTVLRSKYPLINIFPVF